MTKPPWPLPIEGSQREIIPYLSCITQLASSRTPRFSVSFEFTFQSSWKNRSIEFRREFDVPGPSEICRLAVFGRPNKKSANGYPERDPLNPNVPVASFVWIELLNI